LTFSHLRYGPAMTPDYRPNLVRSFERHLRAENRSEHTIASYLESLRQAEAFLAGRGRSLMDARREDLEAFLGELLRRRAPETIATRPPDTDPQPVVAVVGGTGEFRNARGQVFRLPGPTPDEIKLVFALLL
jgi:hypothetical protein